MTIQFFCIHAKYPPAEPNSLNLSGVTGKCLAALSIMNTPKMSNAYIISTITQFIPSIFLKNGVIRLRLHRYPTSQTWQAGIDREIALRLVLKSPAQKIIHQPTHHPDRGPRNLPILMQSKTNRTSQEKNRPPIRPVNQSHSSGSLCRESSLHSIIRIPFGYPWQAARSWRRQPAYPCIKWSKPHR